MTATQDERPEGARVTMAMIGSSTGEVAVRWDERDVMLYALGVGAGLGAPEEELHFTTENSGGVTLQVVPSFVSVLTMAASPPAMSSLDDGRFLHAEQRFDLPTPLPVSGEAIVVNRIEQVLDKGSGAIVVNHASLRSADDGRLLADVRSSIFVRGAGGFDGPRGDFAEWTPPDRPADAEVVQQTRVEQALLYRLSGDRHRLHSDPAFARIGGFDRPILHGLCTYGVACRALVQGAAGDDPARLRGMNGRFLKPVAPGDTLTTQIWRGGDGQILFRTRDGAGDVVLDRGAATLDTDP
ncbi:MAG TPA: MaoC/PaaZ C-terminal domain-containing protein [Sphingobium sp.]